MRETRKVSMMVSRMELRLVEPMAHMRVQKMVRTMAVQTDSWMDHLWVATTV